MILSPILPAHDATTVALDFGVFIATQAKTYRVSQTAIIAALRPVVAPESTDHKPSIPASHSPFARLESTTPSQPVRSSSLGTAADTTGVEVQSSSLASAPVEPIPEPAAPAINPVKPTGSLAKHAAEAPSSAGEVHGRCVPTSPTPITVAGDSVDGAGIPPNRVPTPSAAFSAKQPPLSDRQQEIAALHAEHPDWPASLIGAKIGISRSNAGVVARRIGLNLPSQREYDDAQAAKTTAALIASGQYVPPPAKRSKPAIRRPTIAEQIRAHLVTQPDATASDIAEAIGTKSTSVSWAAQKHGIKLRKMTSEDRSKLHAKVHAERRQPAPVVSTAPNEPTRVVPLHAPRGNVSGTKFYVRDNANRYLHQSLEASPTDDGPLMTINRAYAWFDNAQRFAGAARLWPEINDMRKEGAKL